MVSDMEQFQKFYVLPLMTGPGDENCIYFLETIFLTRLGYHYYLDVSRPFGFLFVLLMFNKYKEDLKL